MLGHIKRHLRAIFGALLLLSLLATIPLIKQLNADGGEAGSTVAATVRIALQNLEVSLAAPGAVSAGEAFDIRAVLMNTGTTKIRDVEVTLLLPEGIGITGKLTRSAGAISSGLEKEIKWKAESDVPGSYVIMVTATGTDDSNGAPITAEATALIEVTEPVHALEVELAAPEVVGVGDRFELTATLINPGSVDIAKVAAELHLPDGIALLGDNKEGEEGSTNVRSIGRLRAGADKAVKWRVVANVPGSYVVTVKAVDTSPEGGPSPEAETSAVIVVTDVAGADSDAQVVTATFGTLEVTVDAPATARVGRRFNVTVIVGNSSSTEVTLLGAEIHLPEGVSLDDGEGAAVDADSGALGPQNEKKIEWRMSALAPGNHVIVVSVTWLEEASGNMLDGEIRLMLEANDFAEYGGEGPKGIVGFASRIWEGLRDLFTGLINT